MPARTVMAGVLLAVTTAAAAACGSGNGSGSGDTADGRPSGTATATGVSAPPPPSVTGTGSTPTTTATPSGTSGTSGGRSATPPSGEPRVLYFSTSVHPASDAHGVLHDRAELDRFASRLATSDAQAAATMRARAAGVDFSRSVLVGWTAATGCSRATSAGLDVSGDRLVLLVRQPSAPKECLATYRLAVLFQAPADSLPAHPVFAGG